MEHYQSHTYRDGHSTCQYWLSITTGQRHLIEQWDVHGNNQQAENIYFIKMEMENMYNMQGCKIKYR